MLVGESFNPAMSLHRLRHSRHAFNAPLSVDKLNEAISLLDLPPFAKVLDIGCGCGEELLRTAIAYEIDGVGIDQDPEALRFGEELMQAYKTQLKGRVTFECRKWQDRHEAQNLHAVFCIGSTQAFGDVNEAFRTTLMSAMGMLKPGGKLLLGDLYWRRHPSAEYLAMLDCQASSYGIWEDDVRTARDAGYKVLAAWESSKEEFDLFEHAMWAASEEWCRADPDSAERQAKWDSVQEWRDMYLREGRDTLGFGLYVLQK